MSQRDWYRQLAVYSSVVFLLPSGLLGGYLLGAYLDDYFGTDPWLMLTGLTVGGIGCFLQVFRLLTRKHGRDDGHE